MIANSAAFDELYTNDNLQRLKDMQRGTLNSGHTSITSPTFKQCWTLDPTGNWRGFNEASSGGSWTLVQSRTSNTVNEIAGITNSTGSSWAVPAYDSAGNMTTIPEPASMGSSYTGTFDAWNRLVQLVNTSSSNTVQQNQYDARNYRTVIKSYTTGTLSETRHSYFSSDWHCIEERTGTSTSADRQFVWGVRYIDDLVLRDRGSERCYSMQDANWNVTTIVDPSAAVLERYAYAAYGVPLYLTSTFGSLSSSAYAWETQYCGYRYDSVSGFYPVRNRFFQAVLGVWITRDPAGYVDSIALYSYVKQSPTGSTDPFGLWGMLFSAQPAAVPKLALPQPTSAFPRLYVPPPEISTFPIRNPLLPWRWVPFDGSASTPGTQTTPASKPIPIPRLPDSPRLSRIKKDTKARGCDPEGSYQCHHLVPQDLFVPGKWGLNMPSVQNDCSNLCCIPSKSLDLTRGGGADNWYNALVNQLVIDNCTINPTAECLEAIADALRPVFNCCPNAQCPKSPCGKCQPKEPELPCGYI